MVLPDYDEDKGFDPNKEDDRVFASIRSYYQKRLRTPLFFQTAEEHRKARKEARLIIAALDYVLSRRL